MRKVPLTWRYLGLVYRASVILCSSSVQRWLQLVSRVEQYTCRESQRTERKLSFDSGSSMRGCLSRPTPFPPSPHPVPPTSNPQCLVSVTHLPMSSRCLRDVTPARPESRPGDRLTWPQSCTLARRTAAARCSRVLRSHADALVSQAQGPRQSCRMGRPRAARRALCHRRRPRQPPRPKPSPSSSPK